MDVDKVVGEDLKGKLKLPFIVSNFLDKNALKEVRIVINSKSINKKFDVEVCKKQGHFFIKPSKMKIFEEIDMRVGDTLIFTPLSASKQHPLSLLKVFFLFYVY